MRKEVSKKFEGLKDIAKERIGYGARATSFSW